MKVTETFFSVVVDDMARATAFYVSAFAATVAYATPTWSSLFIAGVRVGLFAGERAGHARIGLHFVVDDLAAACREVEAAGGRVAAPAFEAAPGVVLAEVEDTEGNVVILRRG